MVTIWASGTVTTTQPAYLITVCSGIFLQKNGMKVTKGQSTKDIICLDFDFGSRSYEEEQKHLTDLLNKADDEAAPGKHPPHYGKSGTE